MNANYRCETTLNGYSVSLMKSAMQKYIRRGNIEKALYAMYELDMFAFHFPDEGKSGKGIHTNMIHRLMIIALEDIGPNNIGIFLQLGTSINKICEFRKARESTQEFSSEFCKLRKKEYHLLVAYIICCCNSSKSREASYYKYIFQTCVDEYERNKKILKLYPIVKKNVANLLNKTKEEDFAIDTASHIFERLIDNQNNDALRIAWIWNNMTMTKKYFNSSKGRYYILYRLHEYINNYLSGDIKSKYLKIVNIMITWTKELKEIKENFLPWLVLLISLLKKNNPILECKLPSQKTLNTYYKLLEKNLRHEKMDIDEYVMDMHTREGKKLNKGPVHFANVSSIVIPEDKNINYVYQKMYNAFKYDQEGRFEEYLQKYSSSEKVRFGKNFVRVQLVCSNAKQDTYFADDNGTVVFVKGPFKHIDDIGNIHVKNLITNFPEIRMIDFHIEYLTPDLFSGINFPDIGIRTKLDLSQKYPFMIMKDIVGFKNIESIPTKIKSSKCWKDTNVVDFDKVSQNIHFINSEILIENDEITKEYILNIMFKYILGIPDLCDRNFYIKNSKEIYSLDLDVIGKKFNIMSSLCGKKRYLMIKDFMKKHNSYFSKILLKWKHLNSNKLNQFEQNNIFYLMQNIRNGI
jgi:hypothetical protein